MIDTATLITQLRVLAHLTRTEAQVARQRIAQAHDDDVRGELRDNAADADARAIRIADVLRDLGALPDPVTPVLGRVAALVRGALEQAQPLDEALLGDLALEHQLRDRARYVAALADAAALPTVRTLADDLVAAHTETVRWLDSVLVDVAEGRSAALDASPLQRVAAQVTRAANAPARAALDEIGATVAHTVDRAVGTVAQAGGEARAVVEEYAGRAARLGVEAADTATGTAQDALTLARDTTAQAAGTALSAGQDALATARDTTAQAADQITRRVIGTEPAGTGPTGTEPADAPPAGAPPADAGPAPEPDPPTPADPPIPGFAELSAQAAVAAVRTLDDSADVAALLAFEQAHGDRAGVVAAARVRARAVGTG